MVDISSNKYLFLEENICLNFQLFFFSLTNMNGTSNKVKIYTLKLRKNCWLAFDMASYLCEEYRQGRHLRGGGGLSPLTSPRNLILQKIYLSLQVRQFFSFFFFLLLKISVSFKISSQLIKRATKRLQIAMETWLYDIKKYIIPHCRDLVLL